VRCFDGALCLSRLLQRVENYLSDSFDWTKNICFYPVIPKDEKWNHMSLKRVHQVRPYFCWFNILLKKFIGYRQTKMWSEYDEILTNCCFRSKGLCRSIPQLTSQCADRQIELSPQAWKPNLLICVCEWLQRWYLFVMFFKFTSNLANDRVCGEPDFWIKWVKTQVNVPSDSITPRLWIFFHAENGRLCGLVRGLLDIL